MCQDSKAAAKIKLVHTLASSPFASHNLVEIFSIAFGLHNHIIRDKPLLARCDLAIDAADMSIIFSLMSGEQTPEDYPQGVKGMLQIKSFVALDPAVSIDARRRQIWEQARLKNIELQDGVVVYNVTGLIDFHLEGTDQVVTIPMNITDKAIKGSSLIARLGGLCMEVLKKYLPPGSRRDMSIPITMQSNARFVNRFSIGQ